MGTTRLDASSCGCEIAWLYKDAHRYGLEQYKELIDGMTGGHNVNCPEGPVLTTSNTEFIARMEACPGILIIRSIKINKSINIYCNPIF